MATWQAVNVNTGGTEGQKYETGVTSEIWVATLTTALANGDTIKGPVIPANVWLQNVVIDVDKLDSNGSPTITFEVGYTGALAAFIASGNTTAKTGGIAIANVAGTVGYTATTPTTVLATITAGPATAQAGKMRFLVSYTGNP
jgi:hypothetical protein